MTAAPDGVGRLVSLDVLRGYTVALMIIVNSPASWSQVYAPLRHARWNGITLTDVVFPFFLFIVGVSIALAYTRRSHTGAEHHDLHRRIAARAARILLLGWLLALWPLFDFDAMRFAGVLPRIAIVFPVCALLFLHTGWKHQLWIVTAILMGYWLLFALVPVPIDDVIRNALATGQVESAHGTMAIGPVRELGDGYIAPNYEPGVNVAAWFDRRFLPGTLWEHTWDPEGWLSTLPAIGTGLLGMLVGRLLLSIGEDFRKLTWLFFLGFAMYLLGGAWGWFMPLNKNLWTSSYTLWTAGLCTLTLAACILLVDVLGFRRGTLPGRVFGANAITAYLLAGMLTVVFHSPIWGGVALSGLWMDALTGVGVPPALASAVYAVLYTAVIFLPAYVLYRLRIFIKV